MHDVFVSYAREDQATVAGLIDQLEARGLSVWWDRQIRTGTRFDATIDDALRRARCVLVVWSSHSALSDWVRMEAQFGMARQILLPVRIEDVGLPKPFDRLQTANLDPDLPQQTLEREFDRLAGDLHHIIEQAEAATKGSPQLIHDFKRAAIAVMPFVNRSGSEDDEYLADGITEDVIFRLQRFRTFPVISRHSTFTYKGRIDDLARIGEELGAVYMVTGHVRRAGQRLRVAVELIELPRLQPMWSETYNREFDDIFDLQDELSLTVAAQLEPEIERRERSGDLPARSETPKSWDLVRRGLFHQYRLTKEDAAIALDFFDRALELEPESVEALIQKSWWYFWDTWVRRRREGWDHMESWARRAYAIEPEDARCSMLMGIAIMMRDGPDKARSLIEESQRLNPSNAWIYSHMGTSFYLAGEPERALEPLRTSLQLSPFDLFAFHAHGELAVSHYMLGAWSEAIQSALASLRIRPRYWYAQVVMIGAYARSGDTQTAARELAVLLERRPDFDRSAIDWLMFTDRQWNEYLVEGLVLAGWEAR